MKWGDLKLVVYLKSRGEYYMGLYQVIGTFVCVDPLPTKTLFGVVVLNVIYLYVVIDVNTYRL